MKKAPNRLINEKSPYLLQHAYNPVNWFPWSEEAFEKAKNEDKPIFLSIGYSTCHWCHVMEKESFEDEQIANLLNKTFVCIKVDREERPDIDAFYMEACQILTGKGGWPLSIFMTYDKKPFYATTYIPKENMGDFIGLKELCKAISYYWGNKRNQLLNASAEIISAIENYNYAKERFLDTKIFNKTYEELIKNFDNLAGGFGIQPKFPPHNNLLFLLKYFQMTEEKRALDFVEKTVRAIRRGGIYDFVSGGIHRYSTDRFWKLPHFEKMLYDQALMTIVLCKTFVFTERKIYFETAKCILDYCIKYLSSEEGGFFCGEDADSEGVEGKFYTWSYEELKNVFEGKDFIDFSSIFNIDVKGNFQEESTGELTGKNVLYMSDQYFEKFEQEEFKKRVNNLLVKLADIRNKRTRPARDEKILLDWNCLLIVAFCNFYKISGDKAYLEKALKTMNFVEKNFVKSDYTLLHSFFKVEAKIDGFLEDYAYLVWAYIELYQTDFNIKWLDKAIKINDKIFEFFEDQKDGGFFHTPNFKNDVPVRQKILYDAVMPSGNSVCLSNLLKLWIITEKDIYLSKAKKMIELFSGVISDFPLAYTFFIYAFSFFFDYPGKIKLPGLIDGEAYDKIKRLSLIDWIVDIIDWEGGFNAIVCTQKSCMPAQEGKDRVIAELDRLFKLAFHV